MSMTLDTLSCQEAGPECRPWEAYKDSVSALYGQWRINYSTAYQTSHPVTQNTSRAKQKYLELDQCFSLFLSKIEITPSQVLALLTTTTFLNCRSTVVFLVKEHSAVRAE